MLTVAAQRVLRELQVGGSIAVNGVCLTATAVLPSAFSADVSPETLRISNLGTLHAGSRVNLERALQLSSRLDGHLVQGHVDALSSITDLRHGGDVLLLTIAMPESIRRYIVAKGSIAVDGISLTVNACDQASFTCTIIPHTIAQTTLSLKHAGDMVNLESDIIGRYVENLLNFRPAQAVESSTRPLDWNFLKKHGW